MRAHIRSLPFSPFLANMDLPCTDIELSSLSPFLECVRREGRLELARVPCDFPQAFTYERVKDLEIFRVSVRGAQD